MLPHIHHLHITVYFIVSYLTCKGNFTINKILVLVLANILKVFLSNNYKLHHSTSFWA